jgi:5-methyltetrahydropteroyltriglutamate--homocysteine methyltransferase
MRRSEQRILTTHAGSLPRPAALRGLWSKPINSPEQEASLERILRRSVSEVVDDQLKAGIDIPNDGEFGKPMRSASDLASWGTYIFGRLAGFGSPRRALPDRAVAGQAMRIVGERWEMREFADFYAESNLVGPGMTSRPACIGPIHYTGQAALRRDLANLAAAADAARVQEAFVTSIAVGSLEVFCRGQNQY